jgi:hypothetical protein
MNGNIRYVTGTAYTDPWRYGGLHQSEEKIAWPECAANNRQYHGLPGSRITIC